MLLFEIKMAVHWYFQLAIKTADNRYIVKIQHFQRNIEQHKQIINCTTYGTSEDRGAARQTDGRSPPSTHVLVAF